MYVHTIGCGNAFSRLNKNNSVLFYSGAKTLLVDAGGTIPAALGSGINSIDAIFITHIHGDHCGGLEEIAFLRYDWVNKPSRFDSVPRKYAPKLIAERQMLSALWRNTLSGGLKSIKGFKNTLETYFEPVPVKRGGSFIWEDWEFKLIKRNHVEFDFGTNKPTFGLFAKSITDDTAKTIFITSDSKYSYEEDLPIYEAADIILQDCDCVGVSTTDKTLKFKYDAHASYAELAGWPSATRTPLSNKIKSKMWLTHYQDFVSNNKDYLGNTCYWEQFARNDGFAGFNTVGKIIKLN